MLADKKSVLLCSGLFVAAIAGCADDTLTDEGVEFRSADEVPNNQPIPNSGGKAATFSTDGFVDLTAEFLTPQGTNGRSCATCHVPEDGWSITPETAQRFFDETDGLHPLFDTRDANHPDAPVGTVEERAAAYSMLLQAKFIRRVNVPATAEFEVIAVDDPVSDSTLTALRSFRRAMPTANFRSRTVSWEGRNTQATLEEGLKRQARSNITGAQEGPPADESTIQEIVDFEMALNHAQLIVPGVGDLSENGGNGGPEAHADQELAAGPFTVFDAWENDGSAAKRQIWRGQKLFNDGDANGRRCGGCHNAANNGQSVNGNLFDVGASDSDLAKADMAVFTLRNKTTGEIIETTDPGRGITTGLWSDVNRFKTMNVRGLAARAPYFHGGTADTLHDVIAHYENKLGFDFTDQEEDDLVAFLNAL